MNIEGRKAKISFPKKLPLLTLFAINLLVVGGVAKAAVSPFYPIPAYLSSKSETIRPNVMLLVDSSGSMTNIRVDGDTRINVARRAFTDLVSNNRDLVRWGFSTFHVTDFVPVADDNADPVLDKIARMVAPSGTGTPTMPIYYQLIRYFQGLPPTSVASDRGMIGDWQNRLNNETTRSPIQYRCQKNFIISLSDGGATGASTATEYAGDTVFNSLARMASSLPAYTDKAFTHDFKIGGLDAEGQPWDDDNYRVQNIITYTIGFGSGMPVADQLNLQQAADNGGGQYYVAGNSAELVASLQNALANIAAMTRPPAAPAYVDDPRTSDGGALSISFSSERWTSNLVVHATNSDGSIDTTRTKDVNFTTGAARNVWFKSASAGNNTVTLRQGMTKMASTTDLTNTFGVTAAETNKLQTWLRGSAVESKAADTRASLFGDVINSDVSMTNKGELFSLSANDGMVHVFKQNANGSYNETFVYMPTLTKRGRDGATGVSEVLGQVVPNLTRFNYGEATNGHQYLVDGGSFYRGYNSATTEGEKHYIVGATGRGGAGVYALDMKQINATGGNDESVIFDITNGALNNLGYTVGTPIIAKVADGGSTKLVALVSNGFFSKYNSATAKGISTGSQGFPTLYAINLEGAKGALWRDLTVTNIPSSNINGLASPAALDIDNDGITDFVYAGDLNGDLYRFDLRDNGRANVDNIVKVFSGTSSKPITSAPAIFKNKDGKFTIVFGTGKLLEESDNTNALQQTVYGITEDGDFKSTQASVSDADLLSQEIISPLEDNRMITTNTPEVGVNYKGWKLNLSEDTGERVVYQPVIYGDSVFFSTQIIIPPADGLLCAMSSGSGYVMSVDAETGSQPLAANAHYGFTNATGDYYAGKKIRGYVANLGGMILSLANTKGTNNYGQVVPGLVSDIKPQEDKKGQCVSMTVAGEAVESFCVMPKSTDTSSHVRTLSWREIF